MAGLVALLTWFDMLSLSLGMILGGVLILVAFAVRVVGLNSGGEPGQS